MKKIFLLLIMSIFVFDAVQAQTCNAPVINSFSPNTGFIGSTVTITGANFDPIPANNQVYFGATQATIVSSSFGTLVVNVPTGANIAPIAVKNSCNKIGYSSVAFNGIFCPTPLTSQTYQNTAFQLNGVYGAYNMLAQDMDMDGKPDVVSMRNGGGFTIARNNSTPGNLNFIAHNFGFGGTSVSTADFDGDGKRDINYPGAVARNTSTGPGNVNFATPIAAGPGGYQTGNGDFNNDGKVDVFVENGGRIYVTINTSTGPGVISFGSWTMVGSVGATCTGLQAADVDGDGKTDILGTQGNNNRAVTLRNITTPGSTTFTFEAPEYWNTNGSYPYRCAIADFNKDGKIDLTTCNYQGATNTAIFINESTVGNIHFATTINLPAPTANYRIGVGDVNGDGYPDIVTKSLGVNVFSVYPNTTATTGTTSFGARYDYSSSSMAEVSGIVIGDLDGDFVPDIATSGISSNNIRFHRNTSSQVDNIAPTAICKNITVALSPTGNVSVSANMIDNGSGDACGLKSIEINGQSAINFTCANIGDNTVTLTVTDIAGNVSTCTATVNVAPAAIIVAGQTTVCQGQSIPMSANQGDTYQWFKDGVILTGETNQTYNATVSGAYTVEVTNAGGCSGISAATNVVVNNNPTVSTTPSGNASLCPPNGSLTITASTSSIYQWKLNGVDIPNATQQTLNVTSAGTYTVSVIDLFGCSATSEPIVVGTVDNIAPVLTTNNITVALDASESASTTLNALVNAYSDNCSNVTLSLSGQTQYSCADVGNTISVSITATDGSGNATTSIATVTVTDPNSYCNAAPIAVCNNLVVPAVGITANVTAEQVGAGSSDPDGDAITYSISPAGPYALGSTNVTVTITDPLGLTSTCNATITVEDQTPPDLSVSNATLYLDANGNATLSVSDIDNGSSDNVGIVSLTLSQTAYNCSHLGTNSVTLSGIDAEGNSSSQTATVTVIDAIAPTASAQNITISLSNGSASISGADVNNGSSDNCDIVSMSVSPNSFGCEDGGDHVVTLTVTDASGNSSSTTATVTVLESTPTLSVSGGTTVAGQLSNTIFLGYGPQSIQLNSVANGGTGMTYSWSPSTGLNNANIANPVASPTVTTTYTLTVTNAGGCSTSESITICVLDIRSTNKKGAFDGKVNICHIPPGNPNNPQILSISTNAVAAHLAHGDKLGACGVSCNTGARIANVGAEGSQLTEDHFEVSSFPNPFNSELTVYVDSHNIDENIIIKIVDLQGRVVFVQDNVLPLTNVSIKQELAAGVYMLEAHQGTNKKVVRVVKAE